MLYTSIFGQNAVKQQLINTITDNRISHAQLFVGSDGYGTLPLALAYACHILCTARTPNGPCGQCAACKKSMKMQHPDLHFVFPVVKPDGKDKAVSDTYIDKFRLFVKEQPYGTLSSWLNYIDAGNSQGIISVDEGREIIRKLNMKAYESDYKVMIIWHAEKMNIQAANSVLKLIEEPPANTIFLQITDSTENILATILSRSQMVKIQRINEEELFTGLTTKLNLDQNRARLISRMCEGDYNQAVELIESSADARYHFDLFVKVMRFSYTGKFNDIINWVEEIAKLGREKQKTFLTYCSRMARENLMINQQQPDKARLTDDERDFAIKFSNFIHPANTHLLQNEFDKAFYHIGRNANAKVVFLDLCIKLNRILKIPA